MKDKNWKYMEFFYVKNIKESINHYYYKSLVSEIIFSNAYQSLKGGCQYMNMTGISGLDELDQLKVQVKIC